MKNHSLRSSRLFFFCRFCWQNQQPRCLASKVAGFGGEPRASREVPTSQRGTLRAVGALGAGAEKYQRKVCLTVKGFLLIEKARHEHFFASIAVLDLFFFQESLEKKSGPETFSCHIRAFPFVSTLGWVFLRDTKRWPICRSFGCRAILHRYNLNVAFFSNGAFFHGFLYLSRKYIVLKYC